MTPDRILDGSPYQAYLYAYPHKTAYRPLSPRVALADAWASERRDALSLYVHVPFCEMRCGFCNLFTTANPKEDVVRAWGATLARQAARVRDAIAPARFARFAMGGGTPTILDASDLARVLDLAERTMGADLAAIPASVEVSPDTLASGSDHEKLRLLRARGVDRISIGVQSYLEHESRSAGRPQSAATVDVALDAIRAVGFPTLNIDLIYGLAEQTVETLLESLRRALRHRPEELYLYPLYVRPLTGLGRTARSWDDQRLELYREARSFLVAEGYTQVSMRMFRAAHAPAADGPVYCVQDDGMVGLGVGARSYTRRLHYASDYAVTAGAVRSLVAGWIARDDASFAEADHGFVLDEDEQRRRWIALALLGDGVDRAAYRATFGSDVLGDLPQLEALFDRELARLTEHAIMLTPRGVERSDAIGPWLASDAVRARMEGWAPR